MNAPIVLFAFKRPKELELTLTALQKNHLASNSDLYIFVDAAKRPEDVPKVAKVKQLLDEVSGFRTVYRQYAQTNIGCADSVIQGISYVLERHPSAIIVEDDLITAPNFLDFMNQSLQQYANNPKVYSVAGYTFPFARPADYGPDSYCIARHSPWGWATWANRWKTVDWSVADHADFMANKARKDAFAQGGADLVRMLQDQMEGKSDAWCIRFCYAQFKADGLTIYPTVSKVQNIGFGEDATHTNIFNRYKTALDTGEQRVFKLSNPVRITEYYHRKTAQRYSVVVRVFNKLKTYAGLR
ncbi:glycosyltransferase [Larkinella ripae]